METNKQITSVLEDLGLTKVSNNCFYKESDNTLEYNYCFLLLFQDKFISIIVGRKNRDAERRILSMYHIKTSNDVIEVISRLSYLKYLFPQIVSVPEIKITQMYL